jgi:hypothetical protein
MFDYWRVGWILRILETHRGLDPVARETHVRNSLEKHNLDLQEKLQKHTVLFG